MVSSSQRFDRLPVGEPRLLEGIRLFNAGAFFESHEVWEALWHEVGGAERELLQGLIQLAAAYHHLMRQNPRGALELYTKGRARVTAWAPRHAGLALDGLLVDVDADFTQLQHGEQPTGRPQLVVVSSDRPKPPSR